MRRALNNQRIGPFLFWLLRYKYISDFKKKFNNKVLIIFKIGNASWFSFCSFIGLILEAYCRGSQDQMGALSKQMDCLDKLGPELGIAYEQVKQRKDRKAALQGFQDFIKEAHCQEAINCILNPLNPSLKWRGIM